MLKKVSFKYNGKSVNINAKECRGLGKFFGLMFKTKEGADALLFKFEKPVNFRIHSFFVFFPFLAIWFDGRGKVIQMNKVSPFTVAVSPKKPFKQLLEIPFNKRYEQKFKNLR